MSSDIDAFQSLSDTCRQIKSGERSSVEVTEALLNRIAKFEPMLCSYAAVLEEQALQQASRLDEMAVSGAPLGALHGVPVAIKDLVFTEGIPTASGTIVMRDFLPTYDATVLQKLRDAGAVIIGKTQLTEGAFGAHHPSIEPPKNPYNVAHWPGVSSSGSGVSVAAGLAYAALGTDTGGSIRFPSASCGLVGIKPTYGRVSRFGVFPLAESLDHIGPMTRCVEDAARVLGVIAGFDEADGTSLTDPVPNYLSGLADANDLSQLKVGVDWRYVQEGVDAEVVTVVQQACAQFESLGAQLVDVTMPGDTKRLVDDWGVTCAVECAAAHSDYYPSRKSEYGPVLSNLLDLGISAPRALYDELEGVRKRFTDELGELMQKVDVLLTPCMTSLPPTVQAMESTVSDDDARAAFINFTAPFDYSGHPTISLPAGLSSSGLPTSIQLVGPHLGEPQIIQAGAAYESVVGRMPAPEGFS